MKKYEFVEGDEIVIGLGRTVKRIRALVAISYLASAGSLGGYVESEKCLSHDGNAWVYGNAHCVGNLDAYHRDEPDGALTFGYCIY